MSFFHAIILGVVEGFTEFLPISSTAHLMLVSRILDISQTDFVKTFEVFIQLGAITAVIFFFFSRLINDRFLWKKILIAFVPTAIVGFVLYKIIKSYLIGNTIIALWALLIGGLILIIVEKIVARKPTNNDNSSIETISNTQAFCIGLIQSVAIIPGVSRSAATIVPMLLFGSNRKTATEFSFLLAIPTIAAASGYDLIHNFSVVDGQYGLLAVGFIVSFIAALLSIKFLISHVQNHKFISFGIYRVVLSLVFFALILNQLV